jgi:hypothetical protein
MSAGRRIRRIAFAALAALAAMAAAPTVATANIQVDYSVVDLPDPVAGQDTWSYDYTVSGRAFSAGDSINIYFDFGASGEMIYQDIQPATPPANFLLDAADPDQILGPGLLVGTAKTADPGTGLRFSAAFTWLGAGRPGPQYFEMLDADYNVLDRGTTAVNTIPEPATVMLVAAGLGLLVAGGRSLRRE